jgi:hypothetical protein
VLYPPDPHLTWCTYQAIVHIPLAALLILASAGPHVSSPVFTCALSTSPLLTSALSPHISSTPVILRAMLVLGYPDSATIKMLPYNMRLILLAVATLLLLKLSS